MSVRDCAVLSARLCILIVSAIYPATGVAPACGRIPQHASLESRVVGGHPAAEDNWPWLVKLFYMRADKTPFGATGSLISKRHVLTAAHCTYVPGSPRNERIPPANLTIHIGSIRPNTEPFVKAGVARYIYAPAKYLKGPAVYPQNDIAVLELDRDVEFGDRIQPICVPLGYRERLGEMAFYAGFGSKEKTLPIPTSGPATQEPSQEARENILPLRTLNGCPYLSSKPDGGRMPAGVLIALHTEEYICVSGFARSTGKGDSGGPLVVNRNGTHFVVGVVSHGLPNAKPTPHQRFTRVAEHCGWIERDSNHDVQCIEMD